MCLRVFAVDMRVVIFFSAGLCIDDEDAAVLLLLVVVVDVVVNGAIVTELGFLLFCAVIEV